MPSFKCDLCLDSFKDQFAFFEHLKQHYGSGASSTPECATKVADTVTPGTSESVDIAPPEPEPESNVALTLEKESTSNVESSSPSTSLTKAEPQVQQTDSPQETSANNQPESCESENNETNNSNLKNSADSNDVVASRIASIIEQISENVKASSSLASYSSSTSNSTTTATGSLISRLIEREEDIFIQTRKVQYVCPGCSRIFKREKKFAAHVTICCTKEDLRSVTEEIDRQSIKTHCTLEEQTDSTGLFPNRDEYITPDTITEDDDNIIGPDLIDNDDDMVASVLLQKISKQVQFMSNAMCILCDSSFSSKAKLDVHLKKVHPEFSIGRSTKKKKGSLISLPPPDPSGAKKADVLKCTECDRVFNHRNSLVYHMRSHTGERPHQCQACGKSFFATSALKVHMRLHTGDKPFKCDHCGRYFRQWGDLKYHIISIHSSIRSYQCEFCGKDFARKYSLIVHRRIHTGERNYKCDFCGKSFRAATYLQNHRRIHTGEKPHSCSICSKPFRVRSDMKRHMASHNRDHTHSNPRNSQTTEQPPASLIEVEGAQVPNVITLNGFAANQIVTIGSQQLSIGEGDTIQLMLDGRITVDQARQLAIEVRNHDGSLAGEINETTPVITLAAAEGRSTNLDEAIEPGTSVQSSDVVMYSTGDGAVATTRENNTVYVWPVYMNSV